MKFREDRWVGNDWPSIDIDPVDAIYFLPILWHLAATYGFSMPPIIDTIDGYAADFELLGIKASIDVDAWTFSIAFEDEGVRDKVLAELRALPEGYFDAEA